MTGRSGEIGGRAIGSENAMSEGGQLADELAPMVDVWQRLLDQHVPDRAGRCRTCTKGGTGLPSVRWPCSLHGIADGARRSHERTHPEELDQVRRRA
jgi:hypothetical protein